MTTQPTIPTTPQEPTTETGQALRLHLADNYRANYAARIIAIEREARQAALPDAPPLRERIAAALDSRAVADFMGPFESGEITVLSRIVAAALGATTPEPATREALKRALLNPSILAAIEGAWPSMTTAEIEHTAGEWADDILREVWRDTPAPAAYWTPEKAAEIRKAIADHEAGLSVPFHPEPASPPWPEPTPEVLDALARVIHRASNSPVTFDEVSPRTKKKWLGIASTELAILRGES